MHQFTFEQPNWYCAPVQLIFLHLFFCVPIVQHLERSYASLSGYCYAVMMCPSVFFVQINMNIMRSSAHRHTKSHHTEDKCISGEGRIIYYYYFFSDRLYVLKSILYSYKCNRTYTQTRNTSTAKKPPQRSVPPAV